MGALDRAFARRAARLAGSTATGSSPSTTHIDLTCRAASRSQIHDPNEPTLTEPDGFLTSPYARQAGNPFARAFARAQATQEAGIASDHSRSRYTFSSIPKTGETTFTYGTGTESNRNPYSKRVVNTWNDARFQSVKTTTPMATELKQLRDLHPRFAEAEQNDLENGITPRDTTMTFSCDTDASFGYAEDKITEADIHRTLGDSIAGYRPLTAGEKAELYADGPIDAEVWYLLSRHVQGTHNLANAEYSSYDRWRKSGYQPVAIRDPHATIFGMKQADAHGRQVVHALDTLLPNATELDLENERTGKSKVDLTITGLNGRHIHTNDTNRLAYKEMARLKMLEHSASDDFDANDVPTFATSLLNETMIPDSSGFCEVLSIDESAESYGDGRAVLYNADTGLVPMRPEHTEKDAESRVIDAQRTLALTAKALLEHKWRTGQFANGSRPRVVLDIKSSCQILAKMDSMLFGQGDEDGQAITMSNQQTSFRPMSATFDEEGIELCGANDVYSLLNLVPQVTPEEVKAAGIVDKTPGVPGADISDLGYESWLEGEALGPEDRPEDMYQADIESCASELSSQWGDLDDERQSVLATSLGFTMQEVELDPETFVMYAARQIVHANKAMEAASRGETPRRGNKRSSVDTGIRPDLSKNSRR